MAATSRAKKKVRTGLIYELMLPARFYRTLFYAANSRLSSEQLVELFGSPPYNFAGPDDGMFVSRSREMQRETPFTRTGNSRTHKSGGTELQSVYICATRREFGSGSACFKRPYETYVEALASLQDRYRKVFDVGFGRKPSLLHVGGWCFADQPTSFALILESYSGTEGVWSIARHKSADFAHLKPGAVLKVRRRRPTREGDVSEMSAEILAQYELEWNVKIVSVVPLRASNRALTAKILTTNTSRREY